LLKAETARHFQAELSFDKQLDDRQRKNAVLGANVRHLLTVHIRQRDFREILRHQTFNLWFDGLADAAMRPPKKDQQGRIDFQPFELIEVGNGLHVDEHRPFDSSRFSERTGLILNWALARGRRPSMFPRLISAVLFVAATSLVHAANMPPMRDAARGELLYSTHCIACHSDKLHWRDKKLVTDWKSLQTEIVRWQGVSGLRWSKEDIADVAQYLNALYYRYPAQD
jgi:hypothetical protein